MHPHFKTRLNTLVTYIGFSLIIFVSLLLLNTEIRSYLFFKIAPSYARNSHFVKISNQQDHEIFLLGTIHDDHINNAYFSFANIEAIIENLKPQLLLIESRQNELENDRIGDGPCEMPFAYLIAKKIDIPVLGVDWWEKSNDRRSSNENRDDHIFQNILSNMQTKGPMLVLLGYSHIQEMLSRFHKQGYAEQSISNKDAYFQLKHKIFFFPKGMTSAISQRISREKKNRDEEENDTFKEKLNNLIANREQLLKYIVQIGEEQ